MKLESPQIILIYGVVCLFTESLYFLDVYFDVYFQTTHVGGARNVFKSSEIESAQLQTDKLNFIFLVNGQRIFN